MPVRLSSEEEVSSIWFNILYPFGALFNSSGVVHCSLVTCAVSVICNSLDFVLPIELWCNPLDDLVDVDSGVLVLSSVCSGASVVEWAW
jgi:hypothetical protein